MLLLFCIWPAASVLKSVTIQRSFYQTEPLKSNKNKNWNHLLNFVKHQTERYVEAVVQKNICIESTYQYVVAQENQKAVDRAIAEVTQVIFFSAILPN
jgi:hypothetical protein